MDKPVLFEVEEGIALITLNRPHRHNAICQDLLIHLYNYLDEVQNSNDIRVAILTGNGKSFCSGIDLDVIGKDNLLDPRGDGTDFPDAFAACTKPIIGAINGNAITGGFEMALNCDFLLATETTRFRDTHAAVGIHPGWGMTQLLQEAVGQRMAKQISLTCQPVPAQQALRLGLVNEVVPLDELIPRAKAIARDICSVNQDLRVTIKDLIEYRNEASLKQALKQERVSFAEFMKKSMAT